MSAYIYILASKKNGTLYTGVTSDLIRRVYQHKDKSIDGFSKQYDVDRLVYFEQHQTMRDAIQREKNIKHWSRQWKLELIEKSNPEWRDLYEEIT
ncbi:MAG: GIY-YIG nuclease family protein [Alphaproteobacteria bacterium]